MMKPDESVQMIYTEFGFDECEDGYSSTLGLGNFRNLTHLVR
jgi:hypothetical protein